MGGRRSIRLRGWDYQGVATYLLTLVVQDRAPILGDIEHGKVALTHAGRMVTEEWLRVPLIRQEVILDRFVVMPDHFHGIVRFSPRWPVARPVLTPTSLDRPSRSLGALVWGFKCATTVRIRGLLPDDFPLGHRLWQRNYHERLLRTDTAVDRARRYVMANPTAWHLRHGGRTS